MESYPTTLTKKIEEGDNFEFDGDFRTSKTSYRLKDSPGFGLMKEKCYPEIEEETFEDLILAAYEKPKKKRITYLARELKSILPAPAKPCVPRDVARIYPNFTPHMCLSSPHHRRMTMAFIDAARDYFYDLENPHLEKLKLAWAMFKFNTQGPSPPPSLPYNVYEQEEFDRYATWFLGKRETPPPQSYYLFYPLPENVSKISEIEEADWEGVDLSKNWLDLVTEDDAKYLLENGTLPFGSCLAMAKKSKLYVTDVAKEESILEKMKMALERLHLNPASTPAFCTRLDTNVHPAAWCFYTGDFRCTLVGFESKFDWTKDQLKHIIPEHLYHEMVVAFPLPVPKHQGPYPTPSPRFAEILGELRRGKSPYLVGDNTRMVVKKGIVKIVVEEPPLVAEYEYPVDKPHLATIKFVKQQGSVIYNIKGDGNWISTEQGANGWTPSANVTVEGGDISSATAGSNNPNTTPSMPLKKPSPPSTKPVRRIGGNDQLSNSRMTSIRSGDCFVDIPNTATVAEPIPIKPYFPISNLGEPHKPGDSVDRYWHVTTGNWNVGATKVLWTRSVNETSLKYPATAPANFGTSGAFVSFPYSICDAHPGSAIATCFNTYAYWRANASVVAIANAPPQTAGALLLVAVPEDMPRNLTLREALHFPYALLNLASSNTAVLNLPFCAASPVEITLSHFGWNICAFPLTPLAIPVGVAPYVTVSLLMSTLDSEFYCLRTPSLHGIPTHPQPTSGDQYHWSSAPPTSQAIVPFIPKKPQTSHVPDPIVNFHEIATRPGLVDVYTIDMDAAVGTKLICQRLDPVSLTQDVKITSDDKGPHVLTPLGTVMSLFAQWRGTLIVNLVYAGSQQSTGRILVSTSPPMGGCPNTMQNALRGRSMIWDLTVSTECEIEVPFYSETPWKKLLRSTGSAANLDCLAGWIGLYVYSPFSAPPQNPDSASIAMFIRAGDDFVARIPSGHLPTRLYTDGGYDTAPPSTLARRQGETPRSEGEPTNGIANLDLTHKPVPMDVAAYFSQFSTLALAANDNPRYGSISAQYNGGATLPLTLQQLSRFKFGLSTLLTRLFTYFQADLEVSIRIKFTKQDNPPEPVRVYYFAPGTSVIDGADAWTTATFTSTPVITWEPDQGTKPNFLFTIPYSAHYPVVAPTYRGVTDLVNNAQFGSDYGYLGMLRIQLGDFGSTAQFQAQVAVRFVNLKAFLPRPLRTNPMPTNQDGMWSVTTPVLPTHQAGTMLPKAPTQPVYVVRKKTLTYDHWAIRSGDVQISVQRGKHGLNPEINYEDPEGEIYCEAPNSAFAFALAQIGEPYPYHCVNNCTNWVESLTGIELPNTGKTLATALGISAAVATTAFAAKTLEAKHQGLGEMARDTVRASENLTRAAHVAHDAVSKAEAVVQLAKIPASADSIRAAAADMKVAASIISESIGEAGEIVEKITPVMESLNTVRDGAITGFLQIVTKLIGYIMVVFGSPTPLSIAGLITIITADFLPNVAAYFKKIGNPLSMLYYWIASKLGFSVTPEETADQAPTPETPSQDTSAQDGTQPQPQHQGAFKDYNETVHAMKNTEWLITTIFKHLKELLEWLGLKSKTDPATKLAEKHEQIMELYKDSIAAVNSPTIEIGAAKDNRDLAQRLMTVAQEAKSPTHSQILVQTIRNYSTAVNNQEAMEAPPRPEPYVVYIHGKPGSGKSLFAQALARTLAFHLCGDADSVYAPSSADCQYYDGYCQQVVHYIDDIGQDMEGRDWKDFAQLVSTSPFIVPMANLEKKGMTYTSKVIIMTSNFEEPNPRAARFPEALLRRLKCVISIQPKQPPMDTLSGKSRYLNPEEALAVDGPATRFFAADCPLLRFESFDLTSSHNFRHADDVVRHILERVNNATGITNALNALIPRPRHQGPKPKPTSFENPAYQPHPNEIQSSVPTPLTQAIRTNSLSLVQKMWTYRKPLFATATFLSILTSLTCLITLVYNQFKSKKQGAYAGMPTPKRGTAPQGVYSGLPNQPNQPHPRPDRAPRPVRQGVKQVDISLRKNVFIVTSYDDPGRTMLELNGLGLFDRWVATVTHIGLDRPITVTVDGISYPVTKHVTHGEICALYVPGMPQCRDIRRFIRNPRFHQTGTLIAHTNAGPAYLLANQVRFGDTPYPSLTGLTDVYTYNAATFDGLCGAPLVLHNPAAASLVGIHVAGVAGVSGVAIPLTPLLEKIPVPAAQSKILPLPMPGPGVHIPRRSRLQKSPAFGAYPVEKIPAPLSKNDPRLPEGVDVDVVAFSKQNRGDMDKPWETLPPAVDLYFSQCNFPKIRMLNMDEAINGTPLLDGLDMKQSPGYPWSLTTNRRSLFTQDETGKYYPVPELEEAVLACLENPDYFYTTHLKDELRPVEKALAGKTRLIEAAPIHAIIAGRMLLGGLFEYMHARPGEHGSAVGCDPDYHWTPFFHSFDEFSQVWALDYSCFDSTLPSCCFDLIAQKLAKIITPGEGIAPDAIVKYIRSISISKHVFGNEAYLMVGGNPSGCVGTSILNSMINNCVLISAFLTQKDFNPNQMRILTYGDDVLYATNPPIHPRVVKKFFDENTTLIVTPATKAGDFPDESTIWDVTFLKRYFVPDEIRPWYVHPVIEPATYEQSVMWTRGGDFQDVVTSLSFLAHHAGPTNYMIWEEKVRKAAAAKGVSLNILPYSYLQHRWMLLVTS
ncbi:polyprotein [passerivirus B1]|uniref:Genome polyprotein n=2 Tax=Passerivirus TaxID=1511802 RepID=A0A2H5BV49_9PICO|nr:polyprotein [Passerivirus sp.]AUG90519.1 polyprotein [passerivirus B1]